MALFGSALKRSQVRCDVEDCMQVASIAFSLKRPPDCHHGPEFLHLAYCKDHEDGYSDGLACAVCDAECVVSKPLLLATSLPNGKAR